jgi:hypothetical protein
MALSILIILWIEMKLQMIQHSNKLIEEISLLMLLYSSLCGNHIIMVWAHKYYNINPILMHLYLLLCQIRFLTARACNYYNINS